MNERQFIFMGEDRAFRVKSVNGEITQVGSDRCPAYPEWVGKKLEDIKPFLIEKKYFVQEI